MTKGTQLKDTFIVAPSAFFHNSSDCVDPARPPFPFRGYSGTGMKCPNAAHLWQLGWAKPVADLDLSGLTVGRWRAFVLPTASDSISNFLRLTGLAGGTYFINYRQANGQYEQVCVCVCVCVEV